MGVPGVGAPGPAGHHPDLHGPADHRSDRQQEGAQAERKQQDCCLILTECVCVWGGGAL